MGKQLVNFITCGCESSAIDNEVENSKDLSLNDPSVCRGKILQKQESRETDKMIFHGYVIMKKQNITHGPDISKIQ
jgi:hypothetical protein